jgi:DNA polymerase
LNTKNEAVLRELNLYPLWVRRAAPVTEAAVAVAEERPESESTEVATEAVTRRTVTAGAEPVTDCGTGVIPTDVGSLGWNELKQNVFACTACKLRAGCTQTVFGVGDEQAEWLFVGEGPGADEDERGEPFVGQAGKLLDSMLAAIKLKRGSNVFIANVVKCRPPENRTPEAEEIAVCLPYLQQQIALLKPKLIVALGKTAATTLLGRDATLGSLRGTVHDYQGYPMIVTYHPAYLLRSPAEKAKAWQDLCFAVQRMAQ